jgi:ribonuclease I
MNTFFGTISSYLFGSATDNLPSKDVPGDFDYYVMQLSYAPEFCRLNPSKKGSKECDGNFTLVLHSLWPQWNQPRGGQQYPQFCSTEYQNVNIKEVLKSVPNWEVIAPEYDELAEHVWTRHGTCSGLSPLNYFTLAVDLAIAFKTTIKNQYDENLLKPCSICFPKSIFYMIPTVISQELICFLIRRAMRLIVHIQTKRSRLKIDNYLEK